MGASAACSCGYLALGLRSKVGETTAPNMVIGRAKIIFVSHRTSHAGRCHFAASPHERHRLLELTGSGCAIRRSLHLFAHPGSLDPSTATEEATDEMRHMVALVATPHFVDPLSFLRGARRAGRAARTGNRPESSDLMMCQRAHGTAARPNSSPVPSIECMGVVHGVVQYGVCSVG